MQEEVVRRRVQAVGSLYALEESTISAEVEARVERVLVDVGDSVRAGQVLVTLEKTELEYELERQHAAVRQVRAELGLGPNDPLPRDPAQVAFVQRAAADLFDAEQKYRRAEQLFRDHLISQQQLDEASARFKGARAAHDLAVQEVERLKAQLQSSEAASKLAEKKLADTSIRAPFPGSIKERRVSPGEYLKVQSPVMVIVRTDQLRARLAVPEKWAGSVKTGATIDVQVEAYPSQVFRGKLVRINPAVLQDSRTFEVEALLPNADGRLKPGFFIRASLPSELEEKTLTVPEQAVNYRYGVYKVYVLNGRAWPSVPSSRARNRTRGWKCSRGCARVSAWPWPSKASCAMAPPCACSSAAQGYVCDALAPLFPVLTVRLADCQQRTFSP